MNIAHKLNVSLMFWMNLCVECMFIRPRSEKINENDLGSTDDSNQLIKIVKDLTSKGFVRNDYKRKLVDLSDIRINLKGKK